MEDGWTTEDYLKAHSTWWGWESPEKGPLKPSNIHSSRVWSVVPKRSVGGRVAQADFVLGSQNPPTEGKTEIAQLLLDSKADVNLQDNDGLSGGPLSSRSMVC